jgi:hypothetical protein
VWLAPIGKKSNRNERRKTPYLKINGIKASTFEEYIPSHEQWVITHTEAVI